VRFPLADPLGADLLDAGDAVGPTALEDPVEGAQVLFRDRDDQLSVDAIRDPLLVAERDQPVAPLPAETRLERPGLVVDAGVDDPAVVAALMACETRLLLEEDEPESGAAPQDLPRDGQANDPASDDDAVEAGLGQRGLPISCRSS
jgi:hypothetical protein